MQCVQLTDRERPMRNDPDPTRIAKLHDPGRPRRRLNVHQAPAQGPAVPRLTIAGCGCSGAPISLFSGDGNVGSRVHRDVGPIFRQSIPAPEGGVEHEVSENCSQWRMRPCSSTGPPQSEPMMAAWDCSSIMTIRTLFRERSMKPSLRRIDQGIATRRAAGPRRPASPNILFLLADDHAAALDFAHPIVGRPRSTGSARKMIS